MAEVVISDVYKMYGKVEAIHGINLHIKDKEFIVFVGPSGCGKSTTLRMIAGLETISAGTMRIGDRIINDLAPKDRRVAMVFQNYALYPHMNVYDNMSFGLKLKKHPKEVIQSRVQEAAEILGLTSLLNRKPYELSGGQRQRVAMGRAIVRKPSVFLFDEPLSNLDAKLRTQMRAEIKRLHQKVKSTIVYVTHDQVEAMTLADRIVVMRDGHIEQVGTPKELFRKPVNTFVAGFIGNPPMNLVPCTLDSDSATLTCRGKFSLPLPQAQADALRANGHGNKDVILGIRPENLSVNDGKNDPVPDDWKVDALVDFVEPLGSETYLHVKIQDIAFQARTKGTTTITEGDKVPLIFDLKYMHLFDAASQQSLL
ncbi:ABC transporter ATP-binding protein [Desulfoplanes formicivorans]|uniref:Sugar ABC transporter ATP-binding protein n=1 Tax=Desulfoplanes formicivorans TaxID=1592317 RepID=A0A194AFD2_9BACT|nr:sn-glycerol-3-phosphate ABC transporter ATP-binding protein UgpC [Desulfoplanes formicivorans]GAU07489.1 sugar ABC transporter ATP-binding protein [Desulfoplanes formicivorans]